MFMALGDLGGNGSWASSASGDGSVIAGYSDNDSVDAEEFR
jgi:uncharacterized membrane protein